jgi:hypothetical protein
MHSDWRHDGGGRRRRDDGRARDGPSDQVPPLSWRVSAAVVIAAGSPSPPAASSAAANDRHRAP